jgi:hypothetical protein
MTLLRSLKRAFKAEPKPPEQTLQSRTEPRPPHVNEPGSTEVMRAASQEFGTGLRSRLGAGDDGICW